MAIDKAFCNSIYGSPRKRIVDRNNKHASEYMSVSVCLYRVRWNSFLSFCGNLHYCHRYDSFPHKRIILQCSLLLWFFHTPCKGSVAHTLLLPLLSFSSVQSLSRVWLSATPWTAACQASLSITNSQSSLKLMSIESVMPSSHLILCHHLLLPPVPPSIRVFSNESILCMRWPKVLEFQLQNQSFQWTPRTDLL